MSQSVRWGCASVTGNHNGARPMSIPSVHVSSPARHAPAPQLDHALRSLLLAGLALVLLLPVARASTAWLGWMPLWLVGMPAVAWWALHRFRLPAWPARAG